MEGGIDIGRGLEQLINETAVKMVDESVKNNEPVVDEKPLENIKPLTDEEIEQFNSENDNDSFEEIKPLSDDEIIPLEGEEEFLKNKITKEKSNISEMEKIKIKADVMAERMTGYKTEDPKLFDYLVNEGIRINKNYRLPEFGQIFTAPKEYDEQLGNVLTENKIKRFTEGEADQFFKDYPDFGMAYYTDQKGIKGIAINEEYKKNPYYNIGTYYLGLTHEIIHSLQDIANPNMSIEEREYEAYIASTPIKIFREKGVMPDTIVAGSMIELFYNMSKSVDLWNDQVSKKQTDLVKKNNFDNKN